MSDLASYLQEFGPMLCDQLEHAAIPLVADYKRPEKVVLLREPLAAQWDRIDATCACWSKGISDCDASGETGVGKTLIAMVAVHMHATAKGQKGYRAIVYSPAHLVEKWARELKMTIPKVKATIVDSYRDMVKLDDLYSGKTCAVRPEFYIISDSKAKSGSSWGPSYIERYATSESYVGRDKVATKEVDEDGFPFKRLHCPDCGELILVKNSEKEDGELIPAEFQDLEKRKRNCSDCGAPLWSWNRNSYSDRWPVADYIHKRMQNFFEYLILDEAHTSNSKTSATGEATARLKKATKYRLDMTGTIMNGYANTLFPRRFRSNPQAMIDLGFGWDGQIKFTKRYGRIKTVTVCQTRMVANKASRGKIITKREQIEPGIVPSVFGDCLIRNTTFLSLDELGYNLPPLQEHLHPVSMDTAMFSAYDDMEEKLRNALVPLMARGNKAAMATLIQSLLFWPDHPFEYGDIGYKDIDGHFKVIMTAPELAANITHRKENALIEAVKRSIKAGNQCWVYNTMSGVRDVHERLFRVCTSNGIDARVLRADKVPPKSREAWIRANGKAQVIIVHPKCVATGLDAFLADEFGGYEYNFNDLYFYNTGYELDIVRQASGRARRIGQKKVSSVNYFYYSGTMQENCAHLMSRKTRAAKAIDGDFIDRGLATLAGDGDDIQMTLVKNLLGVIAA